MRVLVVARSTIGHIRKGGMEYATRTLVEELANAGYSLSLLTTSGFNGTLKHPYKHVWVVNRAKPGRYSIAWWVATAKTGPWWEWKPDIILSVSMAARSIALFKHRVPVIGHCHGTPCTDFISSLKSPGVKEFLKSTVNVLRIPPSVLTYRKFDTVVVVSAKLKTHLMRWPYQLPSSKTVEIPNGVQEERWSFSTIARQTFRNAHDIPLTARTVLYLGQLYRQKGVDLCINSLRSNLCEDIHLIIAGSGPDEPNLRKLVKAHGLEHRIHFTGQLVASAVVDAMSAADSVIVPSRRVEGLPMVHLQAAANGLPIIASKQAAVPIEMMDHVKLVQTTPVAIGDILGRLSTRSVGRSFLPQGFTAKRMMEKFEECFIVTQNTTLKE